MINVKYVPPHRRYSKQEPKNKEEPEKKEAREIKEVVCICQYQGTKVSYEDQNND
jgi:hypothetical protein